MRSCLGDDDLMGGSEDVTSGSRRRGGIFLLRGSWLRTWRRRLEVKSFPLRAGGLLSGLGMEGKI